MRRVQVPKSGINTDHVRASGTYRFFAIAEGMRIPLSIEPICDSDAEASLVAISLSSRVIGVEVRKLGTLVYRAPRRRGQCRPGTLTAATVVLGSA